MCEEGWVSWGGGCFQLGREASSFSQAQELCVALGGNLSSLHILDSQEMIHTHFHTGEPDYTHLCLTAVRVCEVSVCEVTVCVATVCSDSV